MKKLFTTRVSNLIPFGFWPRLDVGETGKNEISPITVGIPKGPPRKRTPKPIWYNIIYIMSQAARGECEWVSARGANWCNESDQADLICQLRDRRLHHQVSFFSRAGASRRCCWEIAVFDHTHAMSAATRFVQPPDASGEAKGRRTDAPQHSSTSGTAGRQFGANRVSN